MTTFPISQDTVKIYIIDTTSRTGNIASSIYLAPAEHYPALALKGDGTPSYSFLIVHERSQRRLLFDLGVRVDWRTNSSRAILQWIQDADMSVRVEKDVGTILREGGEDPEQVEAVIYSHHHFDHTGDPSTISTHAKIIVGPGYCKAYLPQDKRYWQPTSDVYEGREIKEVSFQEREDDKFLRIGEYEAHDYFGDGSFYLLNTPGHTIGHLSALARTTAEADKHGSLQSTFILLGGDVAHHCSLFRPNPLCQLPDDNHGTQFGEIPRTRLKSTDAIHLHRAYSGNTNGDIARKLPFCTATGPHYDVAAAQRSIDVLTTLDGMDNVFTVLAHDRNILDVVDFFPQAANHWKEKGWRENCMWRFTSDLVKNEHKENKTQAKI